VATRPIAAPAVPDGCLLLVRGIPAFFAHGLSGFGGGLGRCDGSAGTEGSTVPLLGTFRGGVGTLYSLCGVGPGCGGILVLSFDMSVIR
jgi:hypothetical protein